MKITKSAIEKWYPIALSTLFTPVIVLSFRNFELSRLQVSATIVFIVTALLSGTMASFLSTLKAFIPFLEGRKIIARLKEANAYRKLLAYLIDAIHWAFILAIISSLGLFLDFFNPQAWYIFVLISWLYALFTMGFSCHRTLRLLNKILHSLD